MSDMYLLKPDLKSILWMAAGLMVVPIALRKMKRL